MSSSTISRPPKIYAALWIFDGSRLQSIPMMKSLKSFTLLALATAASAAAAEVAVYKIDPVHSGISFKIRHFINKVPGVFEEFSGEIHFDKENPANSKAVATIRVASVNTRNDDRDAHLRNEDFFTVSEYPEITFTSTEWEPTGENTFSVTGDLSMVGQTHPVTMEVTFLGEMEGRGKIRSGWEGSTTLDRTEWGMGYGTPPVGKEVEVELNIQAHKVEEESGD